MARRNDYFKVISIFVPNVTNNIKIGYCFYLSRRDKSNRSAGDIVPLKYLRTQLFVGRHRISIGRERYSIRCFPVLLAVKNFKIFRFS